MNRHSHFSGSILDWVESERCFHFRAVPERLACLEDWRPLWAKWDFQRLKGIYTSRKPFNARQDCPCSVGV